MMPLNWTTEPFSDLYAAVQSAVLHRDQVDTATLVNLQELFDVVFNDLCELTDFPAQSSASRDALMKKSKSDLNVLLIQLNANTFLYRRD